MIRACLLLTLASSACTVTPGDTPSDAHALYGAWAGTDLEFLADGNTLDLPWRVDHPSEAGVYKEWTFDLTVAADGRLTLTEAMTTWRDDTTEEQSTCVVQGDLSAEEDGTWSAHLPGPADPEAELPCLNLDASCTLDATEALTCSFTTPDEGTYAGLDASRYEQIIRFEAAAQADTGTR